MLIIFKLNLGIKLCLKTSSTDSLHQNHLGYLIKLQIYVFQYRLYKHKFLSYFTRTITGRKQNVLVILSKIHMVLMMDQTPF